MAASELAVLMAIRVRGSAAAADVARAAGCAEGTAAAALQDLRGRGLVALTAQSRFTLDAPGRDALGHGLAAEAIDRDALADAFERRFDPVDGDLKRAITAWQLADDAAKPRAAATLVAAAGRALEVARDLACHVPRFAPYAARLAVASAALGDGDVRFVANPRVDSVHQVWFELHEDLLVTLGRSRAA